MGVADRVFPNLLFLVWFVLTLYVKSTTIERSMYIVHMDKSFMPKPFTSHHNWYTSIIDSPTFDANISLPFLLYT